MKFTDNFIKGLTAKTSAYRVFEKGGDKGFGIKITPAGSKSFFIQYATDGKQRFFNLGRYPSVSLSTARDKCRVVRNDIDNGIDPQSEEDRSLGNVQELFRHYVETMKADGKRTWHEVERDLNTNCQSILHLPAKDVLPLHIKKILFALIERGAKVQANRIRSFLHRAFEVGIYYDNDPQNMGSAILFGITANPVAAVPKNASAEVVGERNLSFDEIKTLWQYDGVAISRVQLLAIKLILAFGGQRSGEITEARLSEFDFDAKEWRIPPERIKNKRWHILPITPLAEALLKETIALNASELFLFPNRINLEKPQSKTALSHSIARFIEATGFESFTARDLRRTAKTRMGEIGIDKTVRDRVQNHALTDVSAKHYDRWDYMPEKREALLKWAVCLDDLNGY
jgi:integrase